MNIKQAINLNPIRATKAELQQATTALKASYAKSVKAFSRHGYENEMMKTMRARIETGDLSEIPIGKMDINELRETFSNYRDYKAHPVYQGDKFVGYEENLTSTWKGFQDYQRHVAEDVLGYKDYKNLSQDEQRDLWDYIDDIRESRSGYFKPGGGVYGSGVNIKKVTEYYNKGYTREEAIKLLTGQATEAKLLEEQAREAVVPNSPMFLVNKDNF